MHIDLRPFLYLWFALAAVVAVLFGWRQKLARREDGSIHVLHGNGPTEQVSLSQKLDQIDKWGKIMTIIIVGYAILLAALYIYQGLVSPTSVG